jgi:hypothetical protein
MPTRHEHSLGNGSKFYIRRFEPFLATRIFGDLQRKILAPLVSVIEANDSSLSEEQRERNARIAIESLSENLNGRALEDVARMLLNPDYISVSVDGRPPERADEGMLNQAVDGMADLLELTIEVVVVNYKDLFTRGGTLFSRLKDAMPPEARVAIH